MARDASDFDQPPGRIEIDATPPLASLQAARLVSKLNLTQAITTDECRNHRLTGRARLRLADELNRSEQNRRRS
jgi:hypothetical protein